MVHTVLTAIRNHKTVFFKGEAGGVRVAAVGWPAPKQVGRRAPIEQAKDLWKQWEKYFDLHFPMWDVQNSFAAFDLEAPLAMSDRKVLLQALAVHSGEDRAVLRMCPFVVGCFCEELRRREQLEGATCHVQPCLAELHRELKGRSA